MPLALLVIIQQCCGNEKKCVAKEFGVFWLLGQRWWPTFPWAIPDRPISQCQDTRTSERNQLLSTWCWLYV